MNYVTLDRDVDPYAEGVNGVVINRLKYYKEYDELNGNTTPCLMEQAAKEYRAVHGPNVPVVLGLVCSCPKCRVTC